MLSHYHEAAYDAHMTGVAFAQIMKLEEMNRIIKGANDKDKKSKSKEASVKAKEEASLLKNKPFLVDNGLTFLNQMMLDQFGPGRVYHFEPAKHQKYKKEIMEKPEFAQTVYLTFKPDTINNLTVEKISQMFSDYGDFYAYKDTECSCFFEFFFVDQVTVPDKKLETFIEVVMAIESLGVTSGCLHQDAPRFKAHDRHNLK